MSSVSSNHGAARSAPKSPTLRDAPRNTPPRSRASERSRRATAVSDTSDVRSVRTLPQRPRLPLSPRTKFVRRTLGVLLGCGAAAIVMAVVITCPLAFPVAVGGAFLLLWCAYKLWGDGQASPNAQRNDALYEQEPVLADDSLSLQRFKVAAPPTPPAPSIKSDRSY